MTKTKSVNFGNLEKILEIPSLKLIQPPKGNWFTTLKDYLIGGRAVNNRLRGYANIYAGGKLDIEQIRADLAREHHLALSSDKSGVKELLSPSQVTQYHRRVFSNHGLPSTAFGGTPFSGSLIDASLTRVIWCQGCGW